jgi:hypothetical protein
MVSLSVSSFNIQTRTASHLPNKLKKQITFVVLEPNEQVKQYLLGHSTKQGPW